MLSINLVPEQACHRRAVEALIRDAFWNHYVPGCDEHYLAHALRDCPDFVPELDFVALRGDQVVGSIMYTRAKIVPDRGGEREVLCFGPLTAFDAGFPPRERHSGLPSQGAFERIAARTGPRRPAL